MVQRLSAVATHILGRQGVSVAPFGGFIHPPVNLEFEAERRSMLSVPGRKIDGGTLLPDLTYCHDFGLGRRWTTPPWRGTAMEAWAPDIDVFHRNNELTIRADLPGLKRDEVSVDITDDAVTIQGERKREKEEEREGYYRSERSYGSFCRVVPLPEGAITDEAKANFHDGVLEITMPAPPGSKGRRLEITEGTKK
jgi:HSP20 family molecular chaperone IbpA